MKRLNLKRKISKSEMEYLNDWRNDFDDPFYISFVPSWFRYLEWSLIVGVLGYIDSKSSNTLITLINVISWNFLFMYVYVGILRSKFWFYFTIDKKWKRTLSFLVASSIALIAVYIVINTVAELVKYTP